MEIKIFNSAAEASNFAALELLRQIEGKLDSNLGVATGRTMDAIYHKFISHAREKTLDMNKVSAFAVDEYIGLADESANSYKAYLDLHLFNQLNFDSGKVYIPNVGLQNIDQACLDYEASIKNAGGIDFQLLGIGINGHIGLNEPGSSIDSRTRVVALTSSTRNSNKMVFSNENVPLTAITIGIGTILEASRCVMVATGLSKSDIVQKVVNGDINSKVPATAIKQHPNAILILDKESAKLI